MAKQTKVEKESKYLHNLQNYYTRLYSALESASKYHWGIRFSTGCAVVDGAPDSNNYVMDFTPSEETVSQWGDLNDLELRIEERVAADKKYERKLQLREQAYAKLTDEEKEALR